MPGACLSCTGFSAAPADIAMHALMKTMEIVRMVFLLARDERHGLDDVVVVAGRVGDQVRGLALADPVGGAHLDDVLADGLRREAMAPGPECELPEILAQRGRGPGLAPVDRDV